MKKFNEMTFDELSVARREKNEALEDLYAKAANRELTDEEKQSELNLSRELKLINEQMQSKNRESEHAKSLGDKHSETVAAKFREVLQDVRMRPGKAEREILLRPSGGNVNGNIQASGAINLTIQDMIPTLHEGLDLPVGLNMITGVTGNEVWPASINDVQMEEAGEVDALTDQVLEFQNITPTVRRCGLTVPVSNMAIDNAAFDLMGFVQAKFGIALREYLAKKIYSRAPWAGNKGPFSGMKASGAIDIASGNAYKEILKAIAEFSNKGFFEGEVCLSMDPVTEAELKATPKIAGAAGGFVIENGLCAGHRYTVSHFVNSEFNKDGALVAGSARYLMIGYYEWFALQQHGDMRLTIDATSQAVAKKNITAITLNTSFSMTDLSVYINGADNATQAFACYAITSGPGVVIDSHVVKVANSSTVTLTAVTAPKGAVITWSIDAGTATGTTINSSTGVVSSSTTDGEATATATITVGGVSYTDTCKVIVA